MDESRSDGEKTAIALSPVFCERNLAPLMPILNRINSIELILRITSSVCGTFSWSTSARISSSLHSTQRGFRFKMFLHAESVHSFGRNKNAQDSAAFVSSNFENGGVQNVGERSVV